MRLRRTIFLTAALAAGFAMPAFAEAAPLTRLKVRACHAGDTTRDRQATYFSQMRAVPGTARMAMRFSLFERTAGHGLEAVPNSGLQQWRRSRPGVTTFGYAQTVTGLQTGGIYNVSVDYRWFDASGRVISMRRRSSGVCREDGPLPNLTIVGLAASAGQAPGTELYTVQVLNNGAAPAHVVTTDIFVDGAQADTARVDEIDPGATVTVRITGPSCARRIRVVVDRLGLVNETTENDNTLRAACPPVSP